MTSAVIARALDWLEHLLERIVLWVLIGFVGPADQTGEEM